MFKIKLKDEQTFLTGLIVFLLVVWNIWYAIERRALNMEYLNTIMPLLVICFILGFELMTQGFRFKKPRVVETIQEEYSFNFNIKHFLLDRQRLILMLMVFALCIMLVFTYMDAMRGRQAFNSIVTMAVEKQNNLFVLAEQYDCNLTEALEREQQLDLNKQLENLKVVFYENKG